MTRVFLNRIASVSLCWCCLSTACWADDSAADVSGSPLSAAWPEILLGLYCGVILIASLIGGWIPTRVRLTHERMQLVISFVGGMMLGIGMLHLLPHAIHESGSIDGSFLWAVGGIIAMFLLIRMFHVHHHGPFELPDDAGTVVADSYQHKLKKEEHSHNHHDCGHEQHQGHGHSHQPHRLSWFGIALGLGLHTMIDGMALGASVAADRGHPVFLSLFGFGTFLAVVLHKPLDAVSITSLMGAAGWSTRWQHGVNILFALMVPIGASLFLLGANWLGGNGQVIGPALAFSAGVFICISLGDLLPEMEFHRHSRIPLTAALVIGILLAWAITFLEPAGLHGDHHHDHVHESSE